MHRWSQPVIEAISSRPGLSFDNPHYFLKTSIKQFPFLILLLYNSWLVVSESRRGGRVAEGAPLLREYRVYSSIEGSNPSLSAKCSCIWKNDLV